MLCRTEQTSCVIIGTQKNPKSFGLENVTALIGMPGCCSDNKLLLLLLLFYFLQTVLFWYCSEKMAIYPNYVPSNWEQQWVLWGHTCTLTHTKIHHPSRKRHRYWHIQMLLRFAGANVIPRFIEELSSLHTFSGFQIYYFLLPWIGPKPDRFSTIPHKEASSTFILCVVNVAARLKILQIFGTC